MSLVDGDDDLERFRGWSGRNVSGEKCNESSGTRLNFMVLDLFFSGWQIILCNQSNGLLDRSITLCRLRGDAKKVIIGKISVVETILISPPLNGGGPECKSRRWICIMVESSLLPMALPEDGKRAQINGLTKESRYSEEKQMQAAVGMGKFERLAGERLKVAFAPHGLRCKGAVDNVKSELRQSTLLSRRAV